MTGYWLYIRLGWRVWKLAFGKTLISDYMLKSTYICKGEATAYLCITILLGANIWVAKMTPRGPPKILHGKDQNLTCDPGSYHMYETYHLI
jgi:hypothetical protein